MSRILFVTNRNILYTCGELRLIKNRAIALREEYNVESDFIAFNKLRNAAEEDIGGTGTITAFCYRQHNLLEALSAWLNFVKCVMEAIESDKYSVVVLSGIFALRLSRRIKKTYPHTAIVADIHGALEELIEFPKGGVIKTQIRKAVYHCLKHIEKNYLPFVDGCFVVSNRLMAYLREAYAFEKPCYIIPCAIHRQNFDRQLLTEKRCAARLKYGIDEAETVFVYSGGTSSWQCIEESVALYRKLANSIPGKTRLVIFSGDKEYIEKFRADDVIIDSLSSTEVLDTLPMADCAFMLREKAITNAVAYPNKFLEYVLSGLKVITTPYVDDVAEQIAVYRLGYIVNNVTANPNDILVDYCRQKTSDGNVQEFIEDICFENRLKVFVKEFLFENHLFNR